MPPYWPVYLRKIGNDIKLTVVSGNVLRTTADFAQALGLSPPSDEKNREIAICIPYTTGLGSKSNHFEGEFFDDLPPFCPGCAGRIWYVAPTFVSRDQHPLVKHGPIQVWELNIMWHIRNVIDAREDRAKTIHDHISQIVEAGEPHNNVIQFPNSRMLPSEREDE